MLLSKKKKKGNRKPGKLGKYSPRNIENTKIRYLSYTLIIIAVVFIGTIMIDMVAPTSLFSTAASEPRTLVFGFNQDLYVAGDGNSKLPGTNVVMFPYSVMYNIESNETMYVFDSICQNISVIYREMPGASWAQFVPGSDGNSFNTIDPYVLYYVEVTSDCTLKLDPYYL